MDKTNSGMKSGNGRVITRDDLREAVQAARNAATAAANTADVALLALEGERHVASGPEPVPPTPINIGRGTRDRVGSPRQASPQTGGRRSAFEDLMQELGPVFDRVKDTLDVTVNASWVKIEGRTNGHKLYIAKGKTAVGRVESTLPPEAIAGASEPDRYNGRIASWIPATLQAITRAIEIIADPQTPRVRGIERRDGRGTRG